MNDLFKNYQYTFHNAFVIAKNLNPSSIIIGLNKYKTPIGIAIFLMIFKNIYGRLFLIPKRLNHVPHYNFFGFLKRLMQGASYGTIQEEFVVPLYQHKKGGEKYLKKGLLGWQVVISNPEDAKVVLLKTDVFKKAELPFKEGTLLRDYFRNDNLALLSDKNDWKRQRMIVSPAFKKSMPVRLFAEYTHYTFDAIDNNIESPIDITSLMERFTLDIIGKAGFDFEFNSLKEKNNEWFDIYNAIKSGTDDPLFFLFPFLETKFSWLFPHRSHLKDLVEKFYFMLGEVIDHKREILKNQKSDIEDAEKDLLTLMLENELSGAKGLSDSELQSNINLFFVAGHDTTSNAIATAIYYLAKNQYIQQRAREEAINILGNESVNVYPTLEETKKLVFINQIIKETLRIGGPIVQITPRVTTEDTELSGTFIPKNTPIGVNMYDIHHNPNVWKEPNTFNPDRFSPGGEAENMERDGYSWIPFSTGSRICIGMNFSLVEQRVMLSSLLRKYEFYLPEDSIHKNELITSTVGVLGPINLKIIFKPRY